ncbi:MULTISPECIES: cupin domain-containing protein [Cupriavidus]|uniref:Cupin domain-containing protein n=1 Tax=Cupriavidus pauculus TaxID=82633 RepID=A0A3G8H678_9BURK|nr:MULTISPECIES: cupin domain-containing protein [Cupriavidus]AZG15964.1 cupin domain-containing protein [Cupriavidus pauculus]MDT6964132.1 cupin domain-containing protein [Cupriavidus sp. SZY C1]
MADATSTDPPVSHSTLAFGRLYSDDAGESHFGALSFDMHERDFAPPAPAFRVSRLDPAERQGFLVIPTGWVGQFHPAPVRMWIFVLDGEMEFEASDGERRALVPGNALLLEDTHGKGHASRVIGGNIATLAMVQMPGAAG